MFLQDAKTQGFLEAAKQLGIKNKLRPAEFAGLRGMCLPLDTLDKSAEGQVGGSARSSLHLNAMELQRKSSSKSTRP